MPRTSTRPAKPRQRATPIPEKATRVRVHSSFPCVCRCCGVRFESQNPRAVFYSKQHRAKWKREQYAKAHEGEKQARTCEYCGDTFMPTKRQSQRFCPAKVKDCQYRWKREQEEGGVFIRVPRDLLEEGSRVGVLVTFDGYTVVGVQQLSVLGKEKEG